MMNFGNNRQSEIPSVVKNIIIICAIMLVATYVLKSSLKIDLNDILGMYYFQSEHFKIYQIFTHIFMHGGVFHLFMNMFAFYMFGSVLEQVWGPKRFIFYFLATGIGAAFLQQIVNHIQFTLLLHQIQAYSNTPSFDAFELFIRDHISNPSSALTAFIDNWSISKTNSQYIDDSVGILQNYYNQSINVPMVGASGAVFGILLAFGMLFPNTELMLLFPPIPIKAKYFVMGYGAIELYLGLSNSGGDIAHFAHLGGMLFGFILIKYWNSSKTNLY